MFYNTLGFQITNRCFCDCDMCSFRCSKNGSENIPYSIIKNYIIQAKNNKYIKHIAFSGGDPFLRRDELFNGLYLSKSCGFETSCYTNASWCNTSQETKNMLCELEKAKLDILRVSIDAKHNKTIPIQNYRYLLDNFKQTNIKMFINIGVLKSDYIDTIDLLKKLEVSLLNYDVVIFPFVNTGRATLFPKDYFFRTIGFNELKCPKNSILAIRSNGDVFACDMCFHNLNKIANVYDSDLKLIISAADRDKYYCLVRKRGLKWIAEQLQEKTQVEIPYPFTSSCEFCSWIHNYKVELEKIYINERM